MERAFRTWSALTAVDVQRICDKTTPEEYSVGGLSKGEHLPEYTSALNGKTVILTHEAQKWAYRFIESRKLAWSEADEVEREAVCNIHQLPGKPKIFFVQHYCPKSTPPEAHTLVLDFDTGRATMIIAKINHPRTPTQVQREFLFCEIQGIPVTGEPHDFTEDLVGTAITWTYIENAPKIKHIYSAPLFYTYTGNFGGLWMASNPANYVKITDNVYIFSMVEERLTGVQGLFLINMEILHDVGSFFGCHAVGLECYTVGAKGELASMETTSEEYQQMML